MFEKKIVVLFDDFCVLYNTQNRSIECEVLKVVR